MTPEERAARIRSLGLPEVVVCIALEGRATARHLPRCHRNTHPNQLRLRTSITRVNVSG
jgi:hypothetical protein